MSSPTPPPSAFTGKRLRVGYLSPDFHYHATAMLLVEVLELHDRQTFEIFGYSYGTDDRSDLPRRIIKTFDHLVDVRELGHAEAAKRIRDDDIDMLVDLKDYTRDSRTEVLAYRPAPVQVSYLGYPATTGADFIDYFIADSFVVPHEHEHHYSERIVRLAHCYQPNDSRRLISQNMPTRAECDPRRILFA